MKSLSALLHITGSGNWAPDPMKLNPSTQPFGWGLPYSYYRLYIVVLLFSTFPRGRDSSDAVLWTLLANKLRDLHEENNKALDYYRTSQNEEIDNLGKQQPLAAWPNTNQKKPSAFYKRSNANQNGHRVVENWQTGQNVQITDQKRPSFNNNWSEVNPNDPRVGESRPIIDKHWASEDGNVKITYQIWPTVEEHWPNTEEKWVRIDENVPSPNEEHMPINRNWPDADDVESSTDLSRARRSRDVLNSG